MKKLAVLFSLAVLAACGVDGEPTQPTMHGTVAVGTTGQSVQTTVAISNSPDWETAGGCPGGYYACGWR